MAILRSGILGGISGKIGNIVGSRQFGKDTIRVRSISKSEPSLKQLDAQNKFKNIMMFCKQILIGIINYLWVTKSYSMSNINQFIKLNYENFDDDGFATEGIIITKEIGICETPVYDAVLYNSGTGVLSVSLEDAEEPEAQPDDIIDVLVFQKSTNFLIDYIQNFMLRDEGTQTATIQTGLTDSDLIIWIWARRGQPSDSGFQISRSNGRMIN